MTGTSTAPELFTRAVAALRSLRPRPELRIEEGPAGPIVVKLATELPAALVVVGTHGRSGLRRLVLGSVAEGVLHQLQVPVLLIRPFDRLTSGETTERGVALDMQAR